MKAHFTFTPHPYPLPHPVSFSTPHPHPLDVGVANPFDALECEAGFVVASRSSNDVRVIRVAASGWREGVVGTGGSGPLQFAHPTSIAVEWPGLLFVRELGNDGRFQVLSP